jgi:hypothetical protein
MRNSALPIISAMVLVALFALVESRHPSEPPGRYGPELDAGIFRLPTKARLRIASADLDATNAVAVESPAGADAVAPERWRVVKISADDREPLTHATLLGLAEQLTEHGCVVIVEPLGATPLLMPADRDLRVATRSAKLPAEAGGDCEASVAVVDRLLAFAPDLPAAHAQPAVAPPLAARYAVAHRSRAKGEAAWAGWYAGVGRGIASATLAAIAPGGLPAVVDEQRRPRPELPGFVDWQATLPAPPRSDVVVWYGATQEDFVRGWIGEIRSETARDDQGAIVPSIARFEHQMGATRLLKDIAWVKDPNSTAERLVWNREQDGACLAAIRSGRGWDVGLWQERTGVASAFQGWLDAAAAGDAAARRQLRRYATCDAVPAELRAKAAALLSPGQPGVPAPGLPGPGK